MRRFLPVHRIAPLLPTFFIACLGSKMHFQPDEMDRKWKFSGWKEFRHQVWQITSVARKSNLDSLMDSSPSLLRRGPKSKLPIDQGGAATATRRTQSSHGTQRTGNVRTCRILVVRCNLRRSADLRNTSTSQHPSDGRYTAALPPTHVRLPSGVRYLYFFIAWFS